jgi:hypothetical protein
VDDTVGKRRSARHGAQQDAAVRRRRIVQSGPEDLVVYEVRPCERGAQRWDVEIRIRVTYRLVYPIGIEPGAGDDRCQALFVWRSCRQLPDDDGNARGREREREERYLGVTLRGGEGLNASEDGEKLLVSHFWQSR